jgi:NTE family protein
MAPFNPEKIDFLHRIVRIAEKHVLLTLAILKRALVSEEDMLALMTVFLREIDIRETVIPYATATVDLISGKEVILNRGPLINAVMASCAVPGFMPPVAREGMVLVDGGVLDSLPVEPAKAAGAEIVIAVDVGFYLCQAPPIDDGIDVINRATEVMAFCLNRRSRESADILIQPDGKQIHWTGFAHYEELIQEGERATERKLDEIREKSTPRSWRKIFPFPLTPDPWRSRVLSHAK